MSWIGKSSVLPWSRNFWLNWVLLSFWDLVNFVHLGHSLQSITQECQLKDRICDITEYALDLLMYMPWRIAPSYGSGTMDFLYVLVSLCNCLLVIQNAIFSIGDLCRCSSMCFFFLKRNGCIHWLLAHPLAFEALWVRLKRLSWRFGMTHNMANARCHARYIYVVRHNFSWRVHVAIFWGGWS